MLFGCAGQILEPKGKVRETFHKCYKHPLVKTIVNTKRVVGIKSDPHTFRYVFGYYACDTSHNRVDGSVNFDLARAFDILYINHYTFKGELHFKSKMARGYTVGDTSKVTLELYDKINNDAVDYCPSPL